MTSKAVQSALSKNVDEKIPLELERTLQLCDQKMSNHVRSKPTNVAMSTDYVPVSLDQKDEAIVTLSNYLRQKRREDSENSICNLNKAAIYLLSHFPSNLRLDIVEGQAPRKSAFGKGSSAELTTILSQ